MSKELSQNDLDEMELCLGDCQVKVEKDKEEIKQCVSKNSLRKFFLQTIPGNILILLIVYFVLQRLFNGSGK